MPTMLRKGLKMAEENLPGLQTKMIKFMADVKLQEGEVRPMICAFAGKTGDMIVAMVAFNSENQVTRIVWQYSLPEVLEFAKLVDPKDLDSLGGIFNQLIPGENG